MLESIAYLILLLKYLGAITLIALVRIFHEQTPFTIKLIVERTLMGLVIFIIARTVMIERYEMSVALSDAIAAALSLASPEVITNFLKIMKNPNFLKGVFKK